MGLFQHANPARLYLGTLSCGSGEVLGRVAWEASESEGGAGFEEGDPHFSSGSSSRSSEKCSQLPPSPVSVSHQRKPGAKSPQIWPSEAQKCHLRQMPTPCPPAGRLHSLLGTPRAFELCLHLYANLVTWAVFVLVSRA